MSNGFRGIDPAGLTRLAGELEHGAIDIGRRRQTLTEILDDTSFPEVEDLVNRLRSFESWAGHETANLRWRAEAIVTGQALRPGRGIPDAYVNAMRDRALIGAFLPSSFDLEVWSRAWIATQKSNAGRKLGERYLAGEDVSEGLFEISYQPGHEETAAAFFNTLGADLTAAIPQTLRYCYPKVGDEDLSRFAAAFAAASRSGQLTFTVEELLVPNDAAELLQDRTEAAHLLTKPGIAPEWLGFAATHIMLGESYVPWAIAQTSVAAVATGLANNPDVAAEVLSEDYAIETLLRRSSLLAADEALAIGEALRAAVGGATDTTAAARMAAATVSAIGGDRAHPHSAILPHVAAIGGSYLDEIAGSLVAWDHDPTFQPRFEVERNTARRFILATVQNTEAYAITLAATQVWISHVTAARGPTTFTDYTRRVGNRTDDVGMLLATIIGADRITRTDAAAETARSRAMLLDAIEGVAGLAAGLVGPGSVVLSPSIDFLENRAAELLNVDPVARATAENFAFRERVLDGLRQSLYEVIVDLELTGKDAALDPQTLAEQQGAVLVQLLAAIHATMSQFEPEHFK